MNVSILITAYKEPGTIGPAMEAFITQLPEDSEIIVVCPDPETTAVVHQYAHRYPYIRHVRDPQKGKPAALNIALHTVRGRLVVLSDGDVQVGENALVTLLAPFQDRRVGAVSGHPVSVNSRQTLLGYWSHLLTDSIHQMRLHRDTKRKFLLCSGYFFAVRRELINRVPEDALAEDAVISHLIAQQGYQIRYSPESLVYVKYPTSYRDWLKQKVRSAGGYAQDYLRSSPYRMRSARLEFLQGAKPALTYPRSLKEFGWSLLLFSARLHLWALVWFNVRVRHLPLGTLWQRVETTK
ncbi:MAG TPA: glycosyltransferase family 2 protein [bacterium]|nr:glycosyltransferase family 2 protein [bacterium]